MNGSLYEYDVAILKKYGNKLKLTLCRSVRKKGFEIDNKSNLRGQVHDGKLDVSISRAKQKIIEYALCNDFDYFVTLTLDGKKHDRADLHCTYKKLAQWLRDSYSKRGNKIEYVIIPERHLDGNWHFHGLMRGIPKADLKKFKIGDKMGKYIAEKVKKGDTVYNWVAYADKFGFTCIEPIRSREGSAYYITKYVTKGMEMENDRVVTGTNAKMYYNSRGLETATEIKRGSLNHELNEPDYENEYVKVWNGNSDDLLLFTSSIS